MACRVSQHHSTYFVIIVAVFVTCLIVANIIAATDRLAGGDHALAGVQDGRAFGSGHRYPATPLPLSLLLVGVRADSGACGPVCSADGRTAVWRSCAAVASGVACGCAGSHGVAV